MSSSNVSNSGERMAYLESMVEKLLSERETLKKSGDSDNSDEIRLDKMIPVISLIPYELSMMQLPNGKAKYKFNGFGERKLILYQDVINLIELYRHFMEGGYFYIDDAKVIERHGLGEIYSKILTKEKIEEIIGCKTINSSTLYSLATETQRSMINEFIIGKIRDSGEDVKKLFDMNVVREISDIAGFDIIKKGLTARENMALLDKEIEK